MKIIMSCGGTGGHIYPAVAIADKIKEKQPEAEILFIGSKHGMENRLVPEAGYEIKGIDASGIDRRHILNNIKTLRKLVAGGREAGRIIRSFKPDIVIGTGGYVTVAALRQGARFGARCFIHEQNALPGLANRMLAGRCEKVFISFAEAEHYFKTAADIVLTGNPIRKDFLEGEQTAHSGKTLLICGGSLGAEMINRAALELIARRPSYNVIFITGRRYFESVKKALADMPDNLRLIDYENDMRSRMCEADLIVSRSGAVTMAEISAMKKPAVYIPSPNVTGNHQYYNAKAAADQNAAILIEESELSENRARLFEAVEGLINDDERLRLMSCNAEALARADAADLIYRNIFLQLE